MKFLQWPFVSWFLHTIVFRKDWLTSCSILCSNFTVNNFSIFPPLCFSHILQLQFWIQPVLHFCVLLAQLGFPSFIVIVSTTQILSTVFTERHWKLTLDSCFYFRTLNQQNPHKSIIQRDLFSSDIERWWYRCTNISK